MKNEYRIEINDKIVIVTPWEVYVNNEVLAVGRKAKMIHDAASRRDVTTVFSLLQPLLYIASL